MRILMATHDLGQYGGTQSWTYALCRELAMDHTVDVFCMVGGKVLDRIRPLADDTYTAVMPPDDYDLALINHNTCMDTLKGLSAFKVYTQHGPTHWVEQYPGGADAVVAVSEEVQGVLRCLGHDATVIRNGIDLARFWSPGELHDPPTVVSMCKGLQAQAMVVKACTELDWPCKTLHYKTSGCWAVEEITKDADIVVGLGRTALEGLAARKAVLVFDARGNRPPHGDGWITPANVDELARANFSGRGRHLSYTIDRLQETLSAYDPSLFKSASLRHWIEAHANSTHQAQAYLDLAAPHIKEEPHGQDRHAEIA